MKPVRLMGWESGDVNGEPMRWCWRALSAASVAAVLLVALAMLLFTPGPAIAGQSQAVWHPRPDDPAAASAGRPRVTTNRV